MIGLTKLLCISDFIFVPGQKLKAFHTHYNKNFSNAYMGLTLKRGLNARSTNILKGITVCYRINIDYFPIIGDYINIIRLVHEWWDKTAEGELHKERVMRFDLK